MQGFRRGWTNRHTEDTIGLHQHDQLSQQQQQEDDSYYNNDSPSNDIVPDTSNPPSRADPAKLLHTEGQTRFSQAAGEVDRPDDPARPKSRNSWNDDATPQWYDPAVWNGEEGSDAGRWKGQDQGKEGMPRAGDEPCGVQEIKTDQRKDQSQGQETPSREPLPYLRVIPGQNYEAQPNQYLVTPSPSQPLFVEGQSAVRSQLPDAFHNPENSPPYVIRMPTSSHETRMTSPLNTLVVTQPSLGAAGVGSTTETCSPPGQRLIIFTIVASALSMCCCFFTGLGALVFVVQAQMKKTRGLYQESQQRLMLSFTFIITSIFIFIAVLVLAINRNIPS